MAQKVVDAVKAKFGDAVVATSSEHGDEVITVKRDKLLAIAAFLKDDPAMSFEVPVFVTTIDLAHWQPLGRRDLFQRKGGADHRARPTRAPARLTTPRPRTACGSRSATSCARSSTATASG